MSGPPETYASLLRARRGYLSTLGNDGPHVVPVCFTWAGDVIYTAVDGKPKRSDDLQRLKDITSDARVCFIVDRWDEDWGRLAWLQARGEARVVKSGDERKRATTALASKYAQYADMPLDGPVIRIDVARWVGWEAES